MLIQNGANVNAVDYCIRTPLHDSALRGHVDYVKVLIQNGANMNAGNEYKETALHNAAVNAHIDVAKVLILNGADVNAAGKFKQTPLFSAALLRHADTVLFLIQNGAVIDKKALETDRTGLRVLEEINNRMNLLRAGKRIGTSLMSDEERRFMWELAFSLTIQYRPVAFKVYYTIRSFITFHDIFMARGYTFHF